MIEILDVKEIIKKKYLVFTKFTTFARSKIKFLKPQTVTFFLF